MFCECEWTMTGCLHKHLVDVNCDGGANNHKKITRTAQWMRRAGERKKILLFFKFLFVLFYFFFFERCEQLRDVHTKSPLRLAYKISNSKRCFSSHAKLCCSSRRQSNVIITHSGNVAAVASVLPLCRRRRRRRQNLITVSEQLEILRIAASCVY